MCARKERDVKKALRWLDINFEPLCMSVTFFLMAGLITLQVILRFVFQGGFAWGEEVSRFIFVWLVFLAIPYAARNSRHIGIDFIRELFPVPVRKLFLVLVDVAAIVMFGLFLRNALLVAEHAIYYGDKAQTIAVNMNWLYYAAVVGYVLIEIRLLQSLIWKLGHLNSSYSLFQNINGRYYTQDKLFFMPAGSKEEEEELLDTVLIEEEVAKREKRRKGKGV